MEQVVKGDQWQLPPLVQEFAKLRHNGRMRVAGPLDVFKERYIPVLKELHKVWEAKGTEPDFFEKYYLPKPDSLLAGQGGRNGKA